MRRSLLAIILTFFSANLVAGSASFILHEISKTDFKAYVTGGMGTGYQKCLVSVRLEEKTLPSTVYFTRVNNGKFAKVDGTYYSVADWKIQNGTLTFEDKERVIEDDECDIDIINSRFSIFIAQ